MELDKSKTFVCRIDKAEACTAFHATDELMRRILEAENEAFKKKINANTVVVNGRKYGVLKETPGFTNTLFGMKLGTPVDMPDDWDFFLQERPPVQKTNADRIRSMTDYDLADWICKIITYCGNHDCNPDCPLFKCCHDQPSDNIEDWLKSQVEVEG